jgi:ParB/RepB/Spo0J family partition protein
MTEYQLIPLKEITEDENQPRRRLEEPAIDELAETIKTIGVIEPIVVRPSEKGYKIVVGHRRWRAASRAGLVEIPAVVRPKLTPLDVMRMQAVEDAQNEDLDPRDRFDFWAKLWQAEKEADPSLTMARFAREIIGKSDNYVRESIMVSEKASPELKELLGDQAEGKLHPTYARYLVKDPGLDEEEKVAIARKIASGALPAAGGKIGTETLKVVRAAPKPVRDRLIHEPGYGIEQAEWEIQHHEREQTRGERVQRLLTPGQLAFKVLKVVLDFHIKLDPKIAPFLPAGARDEIEARLDRLTERITEFRQALTSPAPEGEELVDVVDARALEALIAEEADESGL